MADTTFVSKLTTILTAWVQGINDFVYRGVNPSWVTSTGSANAQVVTVPGALETSLTSGQVFTFKAGYTNTGPVTLQMVLGATIAPAAIVRPGDFALIGGEIVTGGSYGVLWNGTYFELQGGSGASGQMLGAAGMKAIFYNAQTISEDITIGATQNAGSFGPVDIATGYSVTITSGGSWTIV